MSLVSILILGFFLTGCATFQNSKTQKTTGSSSFAANDQVDIENVLAADKNTNKSKSSKKIGSYNPSQEHSYIGFKGYLNRPPVFSDPRSEAMFKRCVPFEVTGVYQTGQTILVYIKQEGRAFAFTGVNRKAFQTGKNKRLPLLDQHLVKDLNFSSKRKVATADSQRACHGQTWRAMPMEQFLFVIGDPESRQPLKTSEGQFDVWTYKGSQETAPRHYYFSSGKLYSWTN